VKAHLAGDEKDSSLFPIEIINHTLSISDFSLSSQLVNEIIFLPEFLLEEFNCSDGMAE
jgi:hypothetical protein